GSGCGSGLKRTSTTNLAPGATIASMCPASLLPCFVLTRSNKPFTTALLIESFTYGDGLGTWYSRSSLASFSVNSRSTDCRSAARVYHHRLPSTSCSVYAAPGPMANRGALHTGFPRPDVPIPEMWQDMNRRGIGAAIDRRDTAQDVFGVRL